jgi:uncharacterized protein YlxW (UPF0749 family)
MHNRNVYIAITAIFLGFLIALQARSFTDFSDTIRRNDRADIFREVQILKTTNENLEEEIASLEERLQETADAGLAIEGIKKEIERNKILAGRVPVSGPGIAVNINSNIKALWLVDIVNELFGAGAETVSVNGIRLTDKTVGFDTIPSGQILLNGSLIEIPYKIEAIGDKVTLEQVLLQPLGIFARITQSLGDVEVKVERKDLIQMQQAI